MSMKQRICLSLVIVSGSAWILAAISKDYMAVTFLIFVGCIAAFVATD